MPKNSSRSDALESASVCLAEESFAWIPGSLCRPSRTVALSPIDDYLDYAKSLIALGKPEALAESEILGRVLLLGLVSGVEQYFKNVFSRLSALCPLALDGLSEQLVAFGAVQYYSRDALTSAVFEQVTFSTRGELRSRAKRVFDWDIAGQSSLEKCVGDFEDLCHLRHAAVHSRGDLGSVNARALRIPNASAGLSVRLDLSQFHQAGRICENLVRAFNGELFRYTLRRWVLKGVLCGKWDADRPLFQRLVRLLLCLRDVSVSSGGSYVRNSYHLVCEQVALIHAKRIQKRVG